MVVLYLADFTVKLYSNHMPFVTLWLFSPGQIGSLIQQIFTIDRKLNLSAPNENMLASVFRDRNETPNLTRNELKQKQPRNISSHDLRRYVHLLMKKASASFPSKEQKPNALDR